MGSDALQKRTIKVIGNGAQWETFRVAEVFKSGMSEVPAKCSSAHFYGSAPGLICQLKGYVVNNRASSTFLKEFQTAWQTICCTVHPERCLLMNLKNVMMGWHQHYHHFVVH